MQIARVDLWHINYPLPGGFHPAWIPGLELRSHRFDLIRLTTTCGIQGYSAAPAMGREREGLGALLGPYFLGERADDIPSVRQRIREMSYLGHYAGWIEPACWDILGKRAGKPVWKLLREYGRGSADDDPALPFAGRVPLYASTGEVRHGSARIAEVEKRLSEGFSGVKLRVHDAGLTRDIEQISETRRAVGDEPILMADANQGWRVAVVGDAPFWDHERALAFCQKAAELDFKWVEEPLANDNYDGYARLREALRASSSRVDIAGGELNSRGLAEFGVMVEKGCYDVFQPDAVFTGGIAATRSIILQARQAGFRYSPHTWTNGIGFAINLQLVLGHDDGSDILLEYPYVEPGWVPHARDALLSEPWHHDRGSLPVPTSPGLGFAIDQRALAKYGRRFVRLTKARVAVRGILDRGLKSAKAIGAIRTQRLKTRSQHLDRTFAASQSSADRAAVELALEPSARIPS